MDNLGTQRALDIVWGGKAIAEEVGLTKRQTYHLLGSGLIPAQKIGSKWCASRAGLRSFFERALGMGATHNGS